MNLSIRHYRINALSPLQSGYCQSYWIYSVFSEFKRNICVSDCLANNVYIFNFQRVMLKKIPFFPRKWNVSVKYTNFSKIPHCIYRNIFTVHACMPITLIFCYILKCITDVWYNLCVHLKIVRFVFNFSKFERKYKNMLLIGN